MKLILSIFIILTVIGVLEHKAIIPITQFSVLENLQIIASFIKSLHIHSYYLILPDIKITVEGILTVFLILFVIGYISDKFINLELQIKMLNKKIKELNSHEPVQIQDNSKSDEEMKEIARDIKIFLENLAQSITSNQALPIRSKKIRRASSESIKNETTETLVNSSEQDTETVSTTSDCITNTQTDISSVEDDNISKVDLARALIESDEKEKAKEVLKDIIKNGSASDAHEARILNLQIS